MANEKSLQVQQKKELESKEEPTVPGKFYVPYTDIYETGGGLLVTMEVPGVVKDNLEIKVEKNILSVEGRIDFSKYQNLLPLYTEYNIGHYRRSFTLSSQVDSQRINAKLNDGVLTLELPKVKEAIARRISVE